MRIPAARRTRAEEIQLLGIYIIPRVQADILAANPQIRKICIPQPACLPYAPDITRPNMASRIKCRRYRVPANLRDSALDCYSVGLNSRKFICLEWDYFINSSAHFFRRVFISILALRRKRGRKDSLEFCFCTVNSVDSLIRFGCA